ncbi:hypothetical protein [Paraburkholderia tropica]|uniref:hypothetical protein n=1 Tax=Paraburkholderia tropica TaxID=92647 RepID=UPI003D6CA281
MMDAPVRSKPDGGSPLWHRDVVPGGGVHSINHEHRHSAIQFVTPAQRHANLDQDILDRRAALYETARQRNPLRWKGPTRNWQRVHAVHLNPDRSDNQGVAPNRHQEKKAA